MPPTFKCGECGHPIARWPMLNLLRQRILDWRHIDPPAGLSPHRAVLGTPVPIRDVLGAVGGTDEVVETTPSVPAPEVPARPALAGDLPNAAVSIDRLAANHGWEVEAWYMRGPLMNAYWKFNRTVSTVVLRMRRDGHGLVATWQTKNWPGIPFDLDYGEWAFEDAWSLTRYVEPVSSPQLRKIISHPRMICEDCDQTLTLHTLVPGGYVCHDEQTQTEEVQP